MGMDARLEVWVGFNMEHEDAPSRKDIARVFPELVDTDRGDPEFPTLYEPWRIEDQEAFLAKYGFSPAVLYNDCGLYGFGISIHCHDWDYGPAQFDVVTIGFKIVEAQSILRPVCERLGLPMAAFGVWHQTDYR